MILFQNPGMIDLDAALLLGVNAKVGPNPIGFFGSGLKYAISVLLRTGHRVIICTGTEPHIFTAEAFETRGQTFQRICCDGQSLGFTTGLGKKWEVWQAFRELHCNATDEGGTSDYIAANDLDSIVLLPGSTSIIVIGPSIEEAYHKRGEYLFIRQPEIVIPGVAEIAKVPSKHIFYRGIRVKEDQWGWPFTINLLSNIDLTEDRTLKYDFQLGEALSDIGDHLAQIGEIDMLKSMLQPKSGSNPVAGIYWGGFYQNRKMSEEWVNVVRSISKIDLTSLTDAAKAAFGRHTEKEDLPIQAFPLNYVQREQFERALKFSRALGFNANEYPIIFAERLGGNVLGMAKNDKIYISLECFEYGTKMIVGTLIEEYVHLRHRVIDELRAMQNLLLNRIVSLGEELLGEPV